jgi:molybdate transport system ATP-binding protein
MTLEVDVEARLGRFELAARFAAGPGITALFGRSGSGKTSIVNMIAGLLRPARGRIAVDGETLFDAAAGIDVPASRRRAGYVFQDGRLFPHLTVRRNLLYGSFFAPRPARFACFDDVVALLGLDRLLDRRPSALSGGEKQRVAIGRALLASPRFLLMDEPLASLDAGRKGEILPYIEQLRDRMGLPILYVSHSIGEVARLADTVIVLSDGRVAAAGPPDEVMTRLDLRPLTGRYEAGTVLEARLEGHDEGFGLSLLRLAGGQALHVPRVELALGAKLRVRIRARDVALAASMPERISILNRLRAIVREVAAEEGPIGEVRLDVDGQPLLARVTRRSVEELGIVPGAAVVALVKSIAFDRRSLGPSMAGDSVD